jgi:hypothetical protein
MEKTVKMVLLDLQENGNGVGSTIRTEVTEGMDITLYHCWW